MQGAIALGYRDLEQALFHLAKHPRSMLKAFLESGLSFTSLYSVVPICTMAFDIQVNWVVVMCRMYILNLVLYFTRTPGGAGVAEGGFLVLFKSLLPGGISGIIAVLWRFFYEYLNFTLGAIITIRAFGADVITQIRGRRNIE